MMEFTATNLLLFIFGITGFLYYWLTRRPKNFPPGPRGLPILGNMLQLGLEPHKTFQKWSEKYGDIIAVNFGPNLAVVLNDYKIIKEALAENAFSGRPKFGPILERSGGKPAGIIFNDGHGWVEQRRFALKNLRDFGFGKNSMEAMVHIEIEELIATFLRDIGKPISTQGKFNAAVLNALWSIVTGQRYPHDDPKLLELINGLTSSIAQSRALSIALFFPFLRKILPTSITGSSKNALDTRTKTKTYMTNEIKTHEDTWQADSPRDFIDVYLAEMKKTTDSGSSFHELEGKRNLGTTMLDLFAAGAETTSTTLTWAFLLLSVHPEPQEKLAEEIKKVVGTSRLPSLSDRPQMPYTEAVIMEVMRYSTIVPTAVQHYTTEPIKLRGYDIPAGTVVIPNLFNALRSPKVWGDPENFRPERFLTSDETKLVRHEAFIPFSTGKRVCLGETLARDELFLFMTSLFQRFQVGTDYPRNPKPDPTDYLKSIVLLPKPHVLVLQDRFEKL